MFKGVEPIMRKAGELMLSWHNAKVFEKGGHADYVTEADYAVQACLLDGLSKAFPGAAFYAEEQQDNQLTDALTFIIDPIDGTTNYIRGRRCSAISVGAVEGRKPVFGAILAPYRGLMYHGEKGKGAWCEDERIHVTELPLETALIALGTSPYSLELCEKTGRAVAGLLPLCGDLRRSGSAAMDLIDVACGRLDGTFEWDLHPWDYCAGVTLVQEAGGRCGNIMGGEATYEAPIPFMAANERSFDALRKALQQIE